MYLKILTVVFVVSRAVSILEAKTLLEPQRITANRAVGVVLSQNTSFVETGSPAGNNHRPHHQLNFFLFRI